MYKDRFGITMVHMESVSRVQILNQIVRISHYANTIGKTNESKYSSAQKILPYILAYHATVCDLNFSLTVT